MKNAPMRFDGMSLRHNPAALRIENRENIRELGSPCCEPDSVGLGIAMRRISGEGELYGADCIAQYRALEALHRSGRRAKLVLPHMPPLYAYLKELSLTAEPKEDVLSYRFTFIEAQSPRRARQGARYYLTLSQGESLWDIAYVTGTPVETLASLNPQIPYIDDLREGERVRLC